MKAYYYWEGKPETRYLQSCKRSWEEHGLQVEKMEIDYRDYLTVPWISNAVKRRNWAFVSDYLRYVWFQDHDGIWMDSDYFIIRNIPDEFLNADFAVSCESFKMPSQSIMRIKSGLPLVDKIVHFYENFDASVLQYKASPGVFRYVAGLTEDFKISEDDILTIGDVKYFGRSWCYPIPMTFMSNATKFNSYFTEHTFGIHQWHGSQAKEGGAFRKKAQRWYLFEDNMKILNAVLKQTDCEYFCIED